MDEKSHENILIYDFSLKNLICAKSLSIRFDKVNGYSRVYDGNIYLVLKKYDASCNRIRHLISQKVVLHMFFLISMQKSKLINMNLQF